MSHHSNRQLRNPYRHWLPIWLVLLTSACGGTDTTDIQQFMTEVENKPRGGIAPLPPFEPYLPFTYGATNRRSPFEAPIIIPPKTKEQIIYKGLKPPANHVKQFLERFNIAALKMVGSLEQNEETSALVQDGSGGIHRVQKGDYLGTDYGEIQSIDETSINISEIVSDGGSGWLPRPRTITIQDKAD